MLRGSLKVIRGRKKRGDYLVTDNLDTAGDTEMNNGLAIGEKDSSQDNFEGNEVQESKDKFDWENLFHIWSFDANLIYLLEFLQIIFCYELPSEKSILFSILDLWIKKHCETVVIYSIFVDQNTSFKNKISVKS